MPNPLLADEEAHLALFAEGITGRYFHIRATAEFAGHKRFTLHEQQAAQTSDTLYLPEQMNAPDRGAYRVAVMEQIGLRECGTFKFRLEQALAEVPEVAAHYEPPRHASPRAGDYQLFFGSFTQPSLAAEIFNLCERARVLAYLRRTYPGLNKHINRYFSFLLDTPASSFDPLTCAQRFIWGERLPPFEQASESFVEALEELQHGARTAYDSARVLCQLYSTIEAQYVFEETPPYASQEESLPDWLNREQRMEEWEEEMQGMEMAIAAEMLLAEEMESERGEFGEGTVREAEVNLQSLKDEKDTLKRRIDMEKSSVQHALGPRHSNARSFRYDEWNYLEHRYLRHWCRVFEEPLDNHDASDELMDALKQTIRQYQGEVQKRLEQIRPTGLQRVSRIADGDELDLNAIVEARQDIRAGSTPDERFYSRKERTHRDVGALFLVDLSASTDDPIEPPEPRTWTQQELEAAENLRDPWDVDLDDLNPEEPKRKIIDVQRDAMVVMASALEALGDSYSICGFSGYTKDCVEIFVAKEANQGFNIQTLKAIAAMSPKRSTRMGPAIRHATWKLLQDGHALKVMIIISDGFPQDSDYGPERGNHEYGLQDTAKALTEAHQKGVETFCITVDRSGHDYLKRMCPDARYLVIEEMEDLPEELYKVYSTLTSR